MTCVLDDPYDPRYPCGTCLPCMEAERNKLAAAAPTLAEAAREVVDADVFAYLLGESELDGKWHGEGPPEGKHAFWWRTRLRATLARLTAALEGSGHE